MVTAPSLGCIQEAPGQCSQAHDVILGVLCEGPGIGLSDPDQSLPTQHIL